GPPRCSARRRPMRRSPSLAVRRRGAGAALRVGALLTALIAGAASAQAGGSTGTEETGARLVAVHFQVLPPSAGPFRAEVSPPPRPRAPHRPERGRGERRGRRLDRHRGGGREARGGALPGPPALGRAVPRRGEPASAAARGMGLRDLAVRRGLPAPARGPLGR